MSKDEIFAFLKESLVEMFEIDGSKITPESLIYEDLEVDSIDAIDLMLHIKKKTGYQMEASDFKSVKTLWDIVEVVFNQMQTKQDENR